MRTVEIVSLLLVAQSVGQSEPLYLLRATPRHEVKLPVELLIAVDGKAIRLKQLIPVPEALLLAPVWYLGEQRTILFADSVDRPRWLHMLSMDAPMRHKKMAIQFPERPGASYSLQSPVLHETGTLLAWQLFDRDTDLALNEGWGVNVATETRTFLAPSAQSQFTRQYAAGLEDYADYGGMVLRLGGDGRVSYGPGPASIPPPVEFPRAFISGLKAQTSGVVPIVTSKLYVAMRESDARPGIGAGFTGSCTLWVLDREKDQWQEIVVPGSYPAISAFGTKLAFTVRDRRPDRERRTEAMFHNESIWRKYAQSDLDYPGILLVRDVRDGRQWRAETGHPDSEVLLIAGDRVIYRVNDELRSARLGVGKLEDIEVVLKQPEIEEVHWAFFGPAVELPVP